VRQLSHGFEIGAHTFNHVALKNLPAERAWFEIKQGKDWLEDVLGHPVHSFCYPRGKFKKETVTLVREAGFQARALAYSTLISSPRIHSCGA